MAKTRQQLETENAQLLEEVQTLEDRLDQAMDVLAPPDDGEYEDEEDPEQDE